MHLLVSLCIYWLAYALLELLNPDQACHAAGRAIPTVGEKAVFLGECAKLSAMDRHYSRFCEPLSRQ